MNIKISNHGGSKVNIIDIDNINVNNIDDHLLFIREPYWSAMGKNCYATVNYEKTKDNEVLPYSFIDYTVHLDYEINKGLDSEGKKCNIIGSRVSEETYNNIKTFILKDLECLRKMK